MHAGCGRALRWLLSRGPVWNDWAVVACSRLVRRFSERRWRFCLRVAVGLALGGGLFLVGANCWVLQHARAHIARRWQSVSPRSVAIVPGAAVFNDRPSAPLRDRLSCSLDLYRGKKVRAILVSGDHGQAHYNEVSVMKAWLAQRGVPAKDILVDHAGFRTLDTMLRAKRVFSVDDAVICTQGFHLPRAVFLAREAGIDAAGVVSDRRVYAGRIRNAWRERVARGVAVLDTHVLGTKPRYLGARVR